MDKETLQFALKLVQDNHSSKTRKILVSLIKECGDKPSVEKGQCWACGGFEKEEPKKGECEHKYSDAEFKGDSGTCILSHNCLKCGKNDGCFICKNSIPQPPSEVREDWYPDFRERYGYVHSWDRVAFNHIVADIEDLLAAERASLVKKLHKIAMYHIQIPPAKPMPVYSVEDVLKLLE